MKKALISALFLSALASAATEKSVTGSLAVGYQNYNPCRNIAWRGDDSKGVTFASVALNKALKADSSVGMTMAYTIDNDDDNLHGINTNPANKNEFDFGLNYTKTLPKQGLTMTAMYDLSIGGALANYSKAEKEIAHANTQSLGFNIEKSMGKYAFAGITTYYQFQGANGWFFMPYAGVKGDINKTFGYKALVGLTDTASYFEENGAQSLYIKGEAPIKLGEKFSLVPGVSFIWGANPSNNNGQQPFRTVGSIKAVYSF